jgi:hypothetical protein
LSEGHQGECPAFAVIVGTQQNDHILDADDQDQRPHDQGQDAENDVFARRGPCTARGKDRFAHGVERTRADVAVDDADRAQGQRQERHLRGRWFVCAPGGRNVCASGLLHFSGEWEWRERYRD